jgi:peptide/nickel transport system permease protein
MRNRQYILKRLLLVFPVLFGVATFVFSMLHLAPGDPAYVIGGKTADQAQIEAIRSSLGLNDPIWVQYSRYLWDLINLDLGQSYVIQEGQPVLGILMDRIPITVELAVYAQIIGIIFGIPLGVISAVKQDEITDHTTRIGALTGISVPVFWSGPLLILLFTTYLGILPASGRIGSEFDIVRVTGFIVFDTLFFGEIDAFLSAVTHMLMPALAIGIYAQGWISRFMRSSLLEEIRKDYIRTARAKGQGEKITLVKHAFKNSLIPVVTIIGIQFGIMLGGAILTEKVFGIPGFGTLLVNSIQSNDYPVVQGAILVFALLFTLVNILVDILYSYLDPRIEQ